MKAVVWAAVVLGLVGCAAETAKPAATSDEPAMPATQKAVVLATPEYWACKCVDNTNGHLAEELGCATSDPAQTIWPGWDKLPGVTCTCEAAVGRDCSCSELVTASGPRSNFGKPRQQPTALCQYPANF